MSHYLTYFIKFKIVLYHAIIALRQNINAHVICKRIHVYDTVPSILYVLVHWSIDD